MLSTVSSADQLPAPAQARAPRPLGAAEPTHCIDPESQAWIGSLSANGPERKPAAGALRALLLKAARFELKPRHAAISHLSEKEADDLARRSADDALVAGLSKLGEFGGESHFTTRAYKFALTEAAVRVRRLSPSPPTTFRSMSSSATRGCPRGPRQG